MLSHAITMTALTHPLQVLLIGMILVRLTSEGFAVATGTRRSPPDSIGSTVRAAGPSDLQAA
jgi:hypothetical protein